MDAQQYCINGANCITAWPSGGGGSLTGITPGTGITVTGAAPSPVVNFDTTWGDNRYVNATGDTINGDLSVWGDVTILGYNNFLNFDASRPSQGVIEAINKSTSTGWGGDFVGISGGLTASSTGVGSYGSYSQGQKYGVIAKSYGASTDSYAIEAISNGTNSIAVHGQTKSGTGYGGFFQDPTYYTYVGGNGYGIQSNGLIYTSANAQIDGDAYVNGTGGVRLNSQDKPLITRGWDAFTSGGYNGLGRWGLFMEPSALTIGIPNIANKYFVVAKYNADSTKSDMLSVASSGTTTVNGELSVAKTINVNIPGTYAGSLKYDEGIHAYNSLRNTTGVEHCAGDFRSVSGTTVWLACSGDTAYFSGNAKSVSLSTPLYAISAIGTASLQRVNTNGYGIYTSGGEVNLGTNLVLNGNGQVQTAGASNGYYFNDRTVSRQWALYSSSDEARFWNNLSGDVMNLHNNGLVVFQGDVMTNGKLSGYNGVDSYGSVSLTNTFAPTTQGNIYLPVTGGIGFDGNRDNTAFITYWTDNNFYWDMGGGTGGQLIMRPSGAGSQAFIFNAATGLAYKAGGGSWSVLSDGRYKNVTGQYSYGLDAIGNINPVKFTYTENNPMGFSTKDEHIGVVAQELQKVIPDAVSKDAKGNLTVNNDPVIWASVNAIKELKTENDELKSQNESLEWRLKVLESKVDSLMK